MTPQLRVLYFYGSQKVIISANGGSLSITVNDPVGTESRYIFERDENSLVSFSHFVLLDVS